MSLRKILQLLQFLEKIAPHFQFIINSCRSFMLRHQIICFPWSYSQVFQRLPNKGGFNSIITLMDCYLSIPTAQFPLFKLKPTFRRCKKRTWESPGLFSLPPTAHPSSPGESSQWAKQKWGKEGGWGDEKYGWEGNWLTQGATYGRYQSEKAEKESALKHRGVKKVDGASVECCCVCLVPFKDKLNCFTMLCLQGQ